MVAWTPVRSGLTSVSEPAVPGRPQAWHRVAMPDQPHLSRISADDLLPAMLELASIQTDLMLAISIGAEGAVIPDLQERAQVLIRWLLAQRKDRSSE